MKNVSPERSSTRERDYPSKRRKPAPIESKSLFRAVFTAASERAVIQHEHCKFPIKSGEAPPS